MNECSTKRAQCKKVWCSGLVLPPARLYCPEHMTGYRDGVCPQCRKGFRSQQKKIFCTMSCYTESPEFLKRMRGWSEKHAGHPVGEMVAVVCSECGGRRLHKPGKAGKRRFCGTNCYRAWMAKRFDRFVANPETVALPQCYDEFLSRNLLRCPMDGCEWEGHALSNHVNFTHGITAEQFKEMAGFNRNTGLVSPSMRNSLASRPVNVVPGFGHSCTEEERSAMGLRGAEVLRGDMRLEGREHHKKAAALRVGVTPFMPTKTRRRLNKMASERLMKTREKFKAIERTSHCVGCGCDFVHTGMKERILCGSQRCKNKWHRDVYGQKAWKLQCDFCRDFFMGTYSQRSSAKAGKRVYCTKPCQFAYRKVHGR